MKALLLLAAVVPLLGQSDYPRHNLTLGVGAGRPRADIGGLLTDSPSLAIGYGYRFHRHFQADVGLDTMFGAADIRDFFPSQFGDLRIRDYQFLIPFGGRAILPFGNGRVLLSGGGGGVHLRYTERVRQPSNYFRIDCRVCNSRNGWGYYALVGASVAVDRYQRFRLGFASKIYRGHTDGDPFGAVPALRTRDQWVNLYGELGFSF